jgi:hypothetical protein
MAKLTPLLAEHLEMLNKLQCYQKGAKGELKRLYLETIGNLEKICIYKFRITIAEMRELMNLAGGK